MVYCLMAAINTSPGSFFYFAFFAPSPYQDMKEKISTACSTASGSVIERIAAIMTQTGSARYL